MLQTLRVSICGCGFNSWTAKFGILFKLINRAKNYHASANRFLENFVVQKLNNFCWIYIKLHAFTKSTQLHIFRQYLTTITLTPTLVEWMLWLCQFCQNCVSFVSFCRHPKFWVFSCVCVCVCVKCNYVTCWWCSRVNLNILNDSNSVNGWWGMWPVCFLNHQTHRGISRSTYSVWPSATAGSCQTAQTSKLWEGTASFPELTAWWNLVSNNDVWLMTLEFKFTWCTRRMILLHIFDILVEWVI